MNKRQTRTTPASLGRGGIGPLGFVAGFAWLVAFAPALSHQAYAQGTPAGRGAVDYEYTADGELSKSTDGLGRMTEHEYDSLGRRRLTTLPKPADNKPRGTIQYDYSPSGGVSKVTDPRHLFTTSPSNGLGEINPLQSSDTGKTRFTYYPDGKVWTAIDARNQTTTYFYDNARRLTKLKYTSGKPTEFEYDGGPKPPDPNTAVGKLSKVTDESGSTSYEYDGFGRLKAKRQIVKVGDQQQRPFNVTYERGGDPACPAKVSAVRLPSGVRVNYTHVTCSTPYTVSINPLKADGSGPSLGEDLVIATELSFAAKSTASLDPSTFALNRWWWGVGRPNDDDAVSKRLDRGFATRIDMGPITWGGRGYNYFEQYHFYDDAGQLTRYEYWLNDGKKAAKDETFVFDGEGRLTRHVLPATSYGYDYDANGNRTLKTIGASDFPNTISPTSNHLDSAKDVDGSIKSYEYELSGQTKKEGATTFTYSARGRLSSVTVPQGTVSFLYNGHDQRVAKHGAAVDGGVRYYVYDERGQLLGEYDANGRAVYEVIWINDTPLAVITFSGTNPVKTNISNIYSDQVNAPRVIMSTVVIDGVSQYKTRWRWNHGEAFGSFPPEDDPDGLGKFEFNLRFPGQVYDKETGLSYNHHRDYSAKLGRYVESDPIGLAGGINTYAYASGQPTSQIDSYGLNSMEGRPPLDLLHPDSSLSRASLDYWGRKPTDEIIKSLRPGLDESLKVDPSTGKVWNGNTRVTILKGRGYDVNSLPREPYSPSRIGSPRIGCFGILNIIGIGLQAIEAYKNDQECQKSMCKCNPDCMEM